MAEWEVEFCDTQFAQREHSWKKRTKMKVCVIPEATHLLKNWEGEKQQQRDLSAAINLLCFCTLTLHRNY